MDDIKDAQQAESMLFFSGLKNSTKRPVCSVSDPLFAAPKRASHYPLASLLMQSSLGLGLICPIVSICRVTTCALTLRTEVQLEEIVFNRMRRMSVIEAANTPHQGWARLAHACLRRFVPVFVGVGATASLP